MFSLDPIKTILQANYAIAFDDVVFFRDAGSISYVVTSGDQKYFLKIIRPSFFATALSSIDIHTYLQNNHFPVPPIVFTKQGRPYQQEDFDGKPHLWILYDYIEGSEPKLEDAQRVGEVIGQLHGLMMHYPHPLKAQDKDFFINQYLRILEKKDYSNLETYRHIGNFLWEKVKDLPRGYCHGDLNRGNILKGQDGQIYVLDFDTSCQAFPMYDITLFCNQTNYFEYHDDDFEASMRWLERFFSGYCQYAEITTEEMEAFAAFILISHYQLQATIVEIHGLDCNPPDFEDRQLAWMIQCMKKTGMDTAFDSGHP